MQANQQVKQNEEISIKELLLILRKQIVYIRSQWKIILVLFIIGGVAGYVYARSKTPLFQAESTFVLDEGRSGGGAFSGLALLGMGSDASAGLFSSTQNIVWLYKSRMMLYQTLITPATYNGRQRLLIDIFLDESGIRKEINKDPQLKNIHFQEGKTLDSLSKEQTSLVLSCINMLRKPKYLEVTETSKAENLITVSFKSKDEQFSKLFTETLVNNVNQYYIKTKTEKTTVEVELLERKVDSARMMLSTNMYQVASSVEDIPYANPGKATLQVTPSRKRIDVDAMSAMYVELSKNLETRRMALAQETPLIQLLDGPVYPLNVIKPSGVMLATVGAILCTLLAIVILIARNWYKSIMKS